MSGCRSFQVFKLNHFKKKSTKIHQVKILKEKIFLKLPKNRREVFDQNKDDIK